MFEIINILVKSNTINFVIVVGIIVFIFFKLKVGANLQNLADNIKNYVQSAEDERVRAQKKLDVINNKVKKLPEVIERINRSTENSIKNFEQKIQRDIENEKTDISKNAERIFNLETKKFRNKLTNLLSEKSVDLARNNAVEQLKNNRELHNHYIEMAINELDRIQL